MLSGMDPEVGVRFELNRESVDGDAVRYRLDLEHEQNRFRAVATLELASGAVHFEWPEASQPPAWCSAAVRAQLRTLFRDRLSTPFPRRITRWRAAPQVTP